MHAALAYLTAAQLLGGKGKGKARMRAAQQNLAAKLCHARCVVSRWNCSTQRKSGLGWDDDRCGLALQRGLQKALMLRENQTLRGGTGKARNSAHLNVAAFADRADSFGQFG
jgi:hypothetical protein